MQSDDIKLTTTGKVGEIYHGVPDWVFEEEVFEDGRGIWWAPDGKKLVWASFNDSQVEAIPMKVNIYSFIPFTTKAGKIYRYV